jgi:hypothetical protein
MIVEKESFWLLQILLFLTWFWKRIVVYVIRHILSSFVVKIIRHGCLVLDLFKIFFRILLRVSVNCSSVALAPIASINFFRLTLTTTPDAV